MNRVWIVTGLANQVEPFIMLKPPLEGWDKWCLGQKGVIVCAFDLAEQIYPRVGAQGSHK